MSKIAVDFGILRKNYPLYTKLPPHIQNYIDSLNKNLKPGQPKNTPCCLQMSEALNACGAMHKIPPRSYRRDNVQLPPGSGNYYLQAVDELEKYLAGKYGAGEEIKTSDRKDMASMKSYLKDKQGILCFRNSGAGVHTELWDKTDILQNLSSGAPMDQKYIFEQQPHVVFWETTGATAVVGVVPYWVLGWWKVWDGNTYYYFFRPDGVVQYTKAAPRNTCAPPQRADNLGYYTYTAPNLVVKWNPVPGVEMACEETFYNAVPGCRQMNATSNLYSPLVATRLS